MKKCKLCGEIKELSDFHKSVCSKDGYRYACIKCWRNQTNCRYQLNKIHGKRCKVVEVKAPAPIVNVWEWIKRFLFIKSN